MSGLVVCLSVFAARFLMTRKAGKKEKISPLIHLCKSERNLLHKHTLIISLFPLHSDRTVTDDSHCSLMMMHT